MGSQLVLLAGLPHTGKTTYLALLYLAMMEEKRTSFGLAGFTGDREYLNSLTQSLIHCDEMPRTDVSQAAGMDLTLRLGDETLDLQIPDLSGETWDALVNDRLIDVAIDQAVEESTGICVFVHVGELVEDPSIATTNVGEIALGGTPAATDVAQRPLTQVQVVDLVQYLSASERGNLRMSIVLSAFDLAEGETPKSWLRSCAPLLSQYIEMNSTWLHAKAFGISAQGGVFSGASRQSLQEEGTVERAKVVDADGSAADVDAPILWALGRD
jgi:hypothetical protein